MINPKLISIRLFYLIFFLFIFSDNYAQKEFKNNLIQLSGVVISSDSLNQLPYVVVINKSVKRGTVSDYFGYFSLVVQPLDTIIFSLNGFKKSSFILPDSLKENRYSIIHILTEDTLELPMVTVYPWPSKENFAYAFINMKPYDDALRIAQAQLSGNSLAFIASKVSSDAMLSYSWQNNQRNTRLYSMGQFPTNNLFNPNSWSKFIDAWKKGDLKKE